MTLRRAAAIEAASLALFMVSALLVTALLQHPASPLARAVADPLARRALTGMAMGLTLAAIVYSPWGQASGAHLNPIVTLTFVRLGKVTPRDAAAYAAAQFAGGALGVAIVAAGIDGIVRDTSVNYVATAPGPHGAAAAFAGEFAISFVMMTAILVLSNHRRFARFTGIAAAWLVALYITVEAPLSGMSMNPARSLGPAVAAGTLSSMWIYCTAPLAGMLLAAEAYVRARGRLAVRCAKLHHPSGGACQFNCSWGAAPAAAEGRQHFV